MLLKKLIRKKVGENENKNWDTNTNQEKKTGGQRTMNQLKTQWTAIKVEARKQVSKHRKELFKTGGGVAAPEIPVSSSDISAWLPNEFVVDSNKFDSDVSYVYERLEIADEVSSPPAEDEIEQDQLNPDEVKIPEYDKTPTSKKNMATKRRNLTEDNIKRLTKLYMECRKELHDLQIEAEKKRIRNLDREYDLIEA